MGDKEVTIKVVPFVSADKWHNWKAIFLARMDKKDPKVGAIFDLSKEFKLIKKEGEKTVPDEENEKLIASACNELLLSMNYNTSEGENAFNIVKWAKKNGKRDAKEAWKRLIDRYEPKTYLEKGKLMKEFYSASCGPREDPVQFLYELENLRAKVHDIVEGKVVISDKDFMYQVLNSLPSNYESLVENLQALVESQDDPLTKKNWFKNWATSMQKSKKEKRVTSMVQKRLH